jgi:ssRNA-specific RNase YbeY (16S rRNA maturation enzyme)
VAQIVAIQRPHADGAEEGDRHVGRSALPDATVRRVVRAVAARAARRRGLPLRQELVRLVVHGTLHVLGWDHPDDDSRLGSPMWRRQERYVARLAP